MERLPIIIDTRSEYHSLFVVVVVVAVDFWTPFLGSLRLVDYIAS
jgi:hypothetical protein